MRLPLCLAFVFALPLLAGETADPLAPAIEAAQREDFPAAIELAGKVLEQKPGNPGALALRGQLLLRQRSYEKAIADFSALVGAKEDSPRIRQLRGEAYYKNGQMAEAIADWDAVIAAHPERGPHHWQRGLALYYAGRFADGVKQFETHRTVNPDDVENAAWHFLCNARANGVERARKELIPVTGDARIPMAEVQRMFAGELKPGDVLAAAQTQGTAAGPARAKQALFYAHLYIGLYHEACGEAEPARKHILLAAEGYGSPDYMHDTAVVHAKLLEKQNAPAKP